MNVLSVLAMSTAVQCVDEISQNLKTVEGILEKSISVWTKKVVHIAEKPLQKET